MENAVKKTMHKTVKSEEHGDEEHIDKPVKNVKRQSFRSGNKIPRQVRAQTRREKDASDGLKTVKSVQR